MYVYGAMFVFMSVVVTVWGSVGMFVVQRPLLKYFFEPWSVEVCCVYVMGMRWMLCFLFVL